MKKIIKKICIAILAIMFGAIIVLGVKWIKYIDGLNAEQAEIDATYKCYEMGTSSTDSQMAYVVGMKEFVSSDTVAYYIIAYDYLDFGILFDDKSCLDYEYHFINVDTKEEEIYNCSFFKYVNIPETESLRMDSTAFIENGEKKIFFRYSFWDKDIRNKRYGAYIYNLDTEKYEAKYESNYSDDDEFFEMGRTVQRAMQCKSGGLFLLEEIVRNNDLDKEYRVVSGNVEGFYPNVTLSFVTTMLPESNAGLYSYFPELEKIKESGDEYYINIVFPNDMTDEEILKLFIEDGNEINYEGSKIYGDCSVDNLEHSISSYEEFLEYWNEEKALEVILESEIWTGGLW